MFVQEVIPWDSTLETLYDWPGGIQFDSADIVVERKEIIEEYRIRN